MLAGYRSRRCLSQPASAASDIAQAERKAAAAALGILRDWRPACLETQSGEAVAVRADSRAAGTELGWCCTPALRAARTVDAVAEELRRAGVAAPLGSHTWVFESATVRDRSGLRSSMASAAGSLCPGDALLWVWNERSPCYRETARSSGFAQSALRSTLLHRQEGSRSAQDSC